MAAVERGNEAYTTSVRSDDLAGTQIVVFVDALEIFAFFEELDRQEREIPHTSMFAWIAANQPV